jgi:hypothetical protein
MRLRGGQRTSIDDPFRTRSLHASLIIAAARQLLQIAVMRAAFVCRLTNRIVFHDHLGVLQIV